MLAKATSNQFLYNSSLDHLSLKKKKIIIQIKTQTQAIYMKLEDLKEKPPVLSETVAVVLIFVFLYILS